MLYIKKEKPQAFQFPAEESLMLQLKGHHHTHCLDGQIGEKKWKSEPSKKCLRNKNKLLKPFQRDAKIMFAFLE